MAGSQKLVNLIRSKKLTEKDKVKKVEAILSENPELVNAKDDYGDTPLITAINRGHLVIVQLLLAKINLQKLINITTSKELTEERKVEQIQAILRENPELVNAKNRYGETPLSTAIKGGQLEIAKFLLEHGADVNLEYGTFLATPLHIAASIGNEEMTKLLIDKGAKIDAVNFFSRSALYLAIECNRFGTVKLLIKGDANINLQDEDGKTPLHYAAQNGRLEIVKLLLENGANVNAADKHSWTPLHLAANNDWSGAIEELLKHGANVNAADSEDRTPLFVASRRDFSWLGAELITQHIIHISAYGRKADKPDYLEGQHSGYWDDCHDEIEEMQKYTIGNMSKKKVSLYDFFAENDLNQLALYMSNKDIVKTLNTNDYEEEFPIFASKIEYQVQKGVERKCALDPAKNYFSKARLSSTIPIVQEKFNEYIFQEIFKYADNVLLKQIVSHCGELTSIKGAQNPATPEQLIEDDETVSSRFSYIRIKKPDRCVIL